MENTRDFMELLKRFSIIVRLAWGKDGSLFAGETNRGWGLGSD